MSVEKPILICARLFRRLHGLIAQGKGDTEEADTIRDEMDDPWYSLSEVEEKRVRGLSADLYASRRAFVAAAVGPQERAALLELRGAFDRGDWDLVLEMIRKCEGILAPHQVAYMRSRAWSCLGDAETAYFFLDLAAKQQSGDVSYECLRLDSLARMGHLSEAIETAETVLRNAVVSHPRLLLKAADVLLACALGQTEDVAKQTYERLVGILEGALSREELLPLPDRFTSAAVAGWVELGLCYEHLGRHEEARAAYNRALTLHPGNVAALTARAMLAYPADLAKALEDFRLAIRNDSPLVWPYYVVAHHCLLTGDYGRCLQLCRIAIPKTDNLPILADLHEWMAIASYEVGAPIEAVRTYIGRALELAPDNDRIKANARLLDARVGHADGEAESWHDVARDEVKDTWMRSYTPGETMPAMRDAVPA